MLYYQPFLNFNLECIIRKVQGNQVRPNVNGTLELLLCADHVNLLGNNINTI
jgi:hypothetical protein